MPRAPLLFCMALLLLGAASEAPDPAHAAERTRPAASGTTGTGTTASGTTTPASPVALASIRDYYRKGLAQNGIVGSTLVLFEGGRVVLEERYGRQSLDPPVAVSERTTYHWASVTKTLTGIAILQLRDRGLLSLDDPLTKYLPDLAAVHDPYGSISEVTIREAMSHTSGFRDATWPWRSADWQPFEPAEWSQIVAMLPYTEIEFAPGSRYSYSNLAVVFLGEIIERLSGDSFEVYMLKNVLGPLGMRDSYYDRSPRLLVGDRSHSWDLERGELHEEPFDFDTGITRANGGLNAPMRDMLRYLRFLAGDAARQPEYDRILKRSSLEQMWRPVRLVDPNPDFPSRAGAHDDVALSFFIHTDRGVRLVGHPGWQGGFRSQINLDPRTGRGYLVDYNTDATDPRQNTRRFNIELRDYLIDHFFISAP